MKITDGELGLANAFGNRIAATVSQAQRIVDKKNEQLGDALADVEQLQAALVSERAHSAGLSGQIAALKSRLSSTDEILQPTGRKYDDGRLQTKLHIYYNTAFDEFAGKLNAKFKKFAIRAEAK